MRRLTAEMSQWRAQAWTGESLVFERCKGGYFSTLDDYALTVTGAQAQSGTPTPESPLPIQCVKAGTTIRVFTPFTQCTAWINVSNQLAFSSDSFSVRMAIKPSRQYELYLDTNVSTLFRAGVTSSSSIPVLGAPITLSPCVRGNTPSYITLNAGASGRYIWVQISASQRQAIYSLTVIDKSTGKTYKPFAVSEATLPCDLYAGDVWVPMTGKVVRNKQYLALNGTEKWLRSPANNGDAYLFTLPGRYNTTGTRSLLCNAYGYFMYNYTQSASNRNNTVSFDSIGSCLYIRNDRFDTADEFMAYLAAQHTAGTPVTVVYELATPIVEQYDPQPIFAPQGAVQVTQTPVELAANLSATMLVRR